MEANMHFLIFVQNLKRYCVQAAKWNPRTWSYLIMENILKSDKQVFKICPNVWIHRDDCYGKYSCKTYLIIFVLHKRLEMSEAEKEEVEEGLNSFGERQ